MSRVDPAFGSFGWVDQSLALFYRWEGVLTFRFAQEKPLRLETLVTTWTATRGTGYFTIRNDHAVVFEKSYALGADLLKIGADLTPFAEAEDFDFLLFVHNVQSSAQRKAIIYR